MGFDIFSFSCGYNNCLFCMAMTEETKKREPEFDPAYIERITDLVYRDRLGEQDTASMLENDGDNGEKLHARSKAYEGMVRSVLRVVRDNP